MIEARARVVAALGLIMLLCAGASAQAQTQGRRGAASAASARRRPAQAASPLTGVYRIDIASSDKLYTVVAGASSNLPFREQQRFFIDLAVRLTPPDLLAIERRGRRITIGSSRAPRFSFDADGLTHTERAGDGHVVRSRAVLDGNSLMFTSSGRTEDNFSVTFASVDDGRRLRVTRRISAEQLNEPVVIETFYNKISDTAVWNIYGETPRDAAANRTPSLPVPAATDATATGETPARERAASGEADTLRASLDVWIAATNARDIERQMTFYAPQVKAFYLARNVSHAFVHAEKSRVFSGASSIDIRAEAPEIVFLEGGRTAVMRFRKSYAVGDARRQRRGEVVQELRWTRTAEGWKIFSERDIRVIR